MIVSRLNEIAKKRKFNTKEWKNAYTNAKRVYKKGKQLYNQYRDRARQRKPPTFGRMRGTVASVSSSGNVVQSKLKRRGTTVAREGRKKKVRISKEFKNKVKAVLTYRGPSGIIEQRCPRLFKPSDNVQIWGYANPFQYDGVEGWAFSPIQVAQAYDILWNKAGWTFPGSNLTSTSLQSLRPNTEIHVIEQSYRINFKNNSARTLRVTLYDISPKSVQQNVFGPLDFIGNELARTATSGVPGSLTQESRENPTNVQKETIGFKPKMISSFGKFFSCDETVIYLEPGKEYNHTVKGPNDMIYRFQKFYINGVFYNAQKFCKTTLVSVQTDLVTDDLARAVGHFTDMNNPGNPYGLAAEIMHYHKLKCPDQTGFQNPVNQNTGTIQPLTQRGYAFAIKNWYSDQDGSIVDIEDENPQAIAANGL